MTDKLYSTFCKIIRFLKISHTLRTVHALVASNNCIDEYAVIRLSDVFRLLQSWVSGTEILPKSF